MKVTLEFHRPEEKLPEHKGQLLLYVDQCFVLGAYINNDWHIEQGEYLEKVPGHIPITWWADISDELEEQSA